jgi:hypothetical protein
MSDDDDTMWAKPAEMWPYVYVKVNGVQTFGPSKNYALVAHTQIDVKVTGGNSVVKVDVGTEGFLPHSVNEGPCSTITGQVVGSHEELRFWSLKDLCISNHEIDIFEKPSTSNNFRPRTENRTIILRLDFKCSRRHLTLEWHVTFVPNESPEDRKQRRKDQHELLIELEKRDELEQKLLERQKRRKGKDPADVPDAAAAADAR